MTGLKQVDVPTESDSEGDDEFDVKVRQALLYLRFLI